MSIRADLPPQIRTCPTKASGSSGHGFAMRMVIGRVIRAGGNGYLLSSCLNQFQVPPLSMQL